jgi:predicted negative regulator of RcsB-dependent stress response
MNHIDISPSQIVGVNPRYYDAYRIAGDVYVKLGKTDSAKLMYQKALTLEIATENERAQLNEKIEKLH